jgi:tetratricopeptide (TPR) repeat protein
MNEKLFGEKSPVRVVVAAGVDNLFDYETEMTDAKEDYNDMLEKLGLDVAEEKPVERDVQIGHFNADIKGIALKKKGVDRSASEKETVAPAVPDYSRPVIKQLRDAYGKKRAGDLDEAIEICRKIIVNTKATSRQLAKAYDQMARCYLAKGDKDKAAEYFQQLISEFPEEKVYVRKARKELKKLGVGVTGRKPRHKESPENYPDFFGFE